MEPTAPSLLVPWSNFYVIVGSAAAALTGLQFVVIAVAADAGIASEETNRAFGTPTIVHFCAVLFFSAVLSAPWPSLSSAALTVGVFAFIGFVYTVGVLGQARRQKDYVPVLEDWAWHAALPLAAYAAFVVAAASLYADHPALSLFGAAGASLLLLVVGIHNAWDSVTYIAVRRRKGQDEREESEQSQENRSKE